MTTSEPVPVAAPARLRRLRRTPALRRLVREEHVRPEHLILPVFVTEVESEPTEIASMPGVRRWPVDRVDEVARAAEDAGVGALLLFGIPAEKDAVGTQASHPDGVVQRAVRALRDAAYEGVVITDVCLCEYTDHGHCGLLAEDGEVQNDVTLVRLAETDPTLKPGFTCDAEIVTEVREDALTVPLPDGLGSVFVQRDSLVLIAEG